MSFVIILALDAELPIMVWADVTLLYPHDYVLTPKGRMVRASANKVQYLVSRAISDVRQSLKHAKAEDYLVFRNLVVQRLCKQYGFVFVPSERRVIVAEEIEDVVLRAAPRIREYISGQTSSLESGGDPKRTGDE